MQTGLETLIAQLEAYTQETRARFEVPNEQEPYWRGVLFGLELALLEARKQQPSASTLTATFDEDVNQLIYDYLDKLITLCQARIGREALVHNAKVVRYELL